MMIIAIVVVSGATEFVDISGRALRGACTFSTGSGVGAGWGGARGAVLLGNTRALATMTGAAVQDRRSVHRFGSKARGVYTEYQYHTRKKGFSTHLVELERKTD